MTQRAFLAANVLYSRTWRDWISLLRTERISPDAFLVLIVDSAAEAVLAVTRKQNAFWSEHNGNIDLPLQLRAVGCPTFAARVGEHMHRVFKAAG